jgi:hypothetical protein
MEIGDHGYDKEEEYFYRQNQALIDRKRAELDAKREAQQADELRETHWMRCPKCGDEMKEVDMAGLKLDRCPGCEGIFFDAGELEILLEAREPKGFVAGLRRIFR